MRHLALCSLLALCACMRAPPGGHAEPPPPPPSPESRVPSPGSSRKVIHHAELELEAESLDQALRALSAEAEARGGFLLSSSTTRDGDTDRLVVVLRVPAREFQGALAALRGVGRRLEERITGEDVTEEYLDLEARLRAQRAVEQGYLELLARAQAVHDVLEVQQKLGEVRTEIERAEGRRRFLADQVELSTITVRVSAPAAASLAESAREAASDARAVAHALLVGALRLAGVLLPVLALAVLPVLALVRLARRLRRE